MMTTIVTMMIIKDHWCWKPCNHWFGCRFYHNSARNCHIHHGDDEQNYDNYDDDDNDIDDDDDEHDGDV